MADDKPEVQDTGLIEKAFLMGIGAAMLAKDKASELADELVARGKLSREQSESFIDRLVVQAEEAGKSAQTTVTRETERAIAGVGLASAKDVDEIRAELSEIKALIASLRPTGAAASASAENPTDEYTP